MADFTIITACTIDYMKKLKWVLPTWKLKPQFKNRPLLIYYKGLHPKDFDWVRQYYENVTLVEWDMEQYEDIRELMLSSFILGVESVTTEFAVKMDADTYFLNDTDVFDEEDFKKDLVSHSWGYTKPGYWILKLDEYFNQTPKESHDLRIVNHKRIQSICCLQRTSLVKKLVERVGKRLPIPSHDTLLWYFSSTFGYKIGRKNLKKVGVGHSSRWRSIRESICSTEAAFNEYLNVELFKHIQLEVTSYCQLKCINCDRNCGLIKNTKNDFLPLSVISKFIEDSLSQNHQWYRIDIIGGEPTYYPYLELLWGIIYIYKSKYPKCKIRFSTNGLGAHTKEVLKSIPDWVQIRNSEKNSPINAFDAYNSAPVDNGETKIRSCSIPWRCGLALTKQGYFLCGAGASLAKVFDFDIGATELSALSLSILKEQRETLCKYCGHSNCKTKHTVKGKDVSSSWEHAVESYSAGRQ